MTKQKNFLYLHGALGSKKQIEPFSSIISEKYRIHTLDFLGHGENTQNPEIFRVQDFAQQVASFIKDNSLSDLTILGYSLGGHVALSMLYLLPEIRNSIKQVITYGTRFFWTQEIAQKECTFLNPEKIEEKVPKFAALLASTHGENKWKDVCRKTAGLLENLGHSDPLTPSSLQEIQTPILLSVGDSDSLAEIHVTNEAKNYLPNGGLFVFPKTLHPIEKLRPEFMRILLQ